MNWPWLLGRRVELAAVVRARLALAEVVGLHRAAVGAEPLHVDLVQVIRLQHQRADDAVARRALHGELDAAEHDVEDAGELRASPGLATVKETPSAPYVGFPLGRNELTDPLVKSTLIAIPKAVSAGHPAGIAVRWRQLNRLEGEPTRVQRVTC